MTPPGTMREFAIAKTSTLMDDLLSALQNAAENPDEAAVHKLRVCYSPLPAGAAAIRAILEVGRS